MLYPRDTPTQSSDSNNCAIHLFTWCYIICYAYYRHFDDTDATTVRKGVVKLLLSEGFEKFPDYVEPNSSEEKEKKSKQSTVDLGTFTLKKAIPSGFSSTVMFCANL